MPPTTYQSRHKLLILFIFVRYETHSDGPILKPHWNPNLRIGSILGQGEEDSFAKIKLSSVCESDFHFIGGL